MYLFFDTETTGLPIDYGAHLHDVDNWPRLVQIAWVACTSEDDAVVRNHVIFPNGFDIPEAASNIHGITTSEAIEHGIPVEIALAEFCVALEFSDTIVGHNVNFDRKIVSAELIRVGREEDYEIIKNFDRICTMMKSTKFCGLKQGNTKRAKWPDLNELHVALFGEELVGAHDAMVDIMATVRCFFELKDKGIIE